MLELTVKDQRELVSEDVLRQAMQCNAEILRRAQAGEAKYSDSQGWLDVNEWASDAILTHIEQIAADVRAHCDAFVIIGVGGSNNAARSVIEALAQQSGDTEIIYAGNTLNPNALNRMLKSLEGKDYAIDCIAKNFETLEPGSSFRILRKAMTAKYGPEEAARRTICTGTYGSSLEELCKAEGYTFVPFPTNVGGRYTAMTYVGLLPMAVAGIDISAVLAGGSLAREELNIRSFENPAWQYAASRYLLAQTGKQIELLCAWEPDAAYLGRWWQQLFGESEGKEGKGLFPAFLEYSADLHSMGQMVQQGRRNLFETILTFDPPQKKAAVELDWKDLDGLNYLDGKTLDFVERQACAGVIGAHVDGGVPIITIDAGPLDAHKLGELFYFFELSCALSAYMLGVNPFDQPGVEAYKENMFRLLGRPEK